MPNWLGDCVMAMPAVRHLAETLPKAGIFLAARPAFRDLLLAQPGVAGFVEAPGSGIGKLLRGMSGTRRLVRDSGLPGSVDVGLLFTNSLSTAAWMWRTGAKIRIGYNLDCRRVFLTHPVPCGGVELSWHFIDYYLWLAKFTESAFDESDDVSRRQVASHNEYQIPSLAVGEKGGAEAAEVLRTAGVAGPYAVIAPASAYGPVKDWPAGYYRQLVESLNRDFSLPVLVTGGAGQRDVCADIVRDQAAAVNLAGKTGLDGFAGLLAKASLFVGGDSGGAHAAAAFGIPTLVIFGITNPTRTRPTGEKVRMLGAGEDHDVKLSSPTAREAARLALEKIHPEEALAAVKEMLRA